jgi:Protein of unknown function (DUF3422)
MPDFDIHDDYYLINGGAHLKTSARFGPPALTNHVALWMPKAPEAQSASVLANRSARERWLEQIDRYLLRFVRIAVGHENQFSHRYSVRFLRHSATGLIGTDAVEPSLVPLPREEVEQHRQEVFSFDFLFHSIPMQLRAAVHSEFVTLTIIAELRPREFKADDDDLRATIKECFATLAVRMPERLNDLVKNDRHYASRPSKIAGVKTRRAVTDLGNGPNFLFSGFWDAFWEHYDDCLTPELKKGMGSAFGDLRGLILSGDLGVDHNIMSWTLDEPFVAETTVDHTVHFDRLKEEHVLAFADSLRLVLDAAPSPLSESSEAPSEGERSVQPAMDYSAAHFLDSRVMYLSTLSAQRQSKCNSNRRMRYEPLRYLVFGPRNRWQMGRLVERIHHLDTYRLASLVELTELNKANESLKRFEKTTRVAGSSEDLQRAQKELSNIESSFSGGLDYRLERARRYISGFRSVAIQLRSRRVEGYQPYDEFVQRRIGSFWTFINRLGDRLERARARVDSLNVKIQTVEQQKQTSEQTKLLQFAELVTAVAIGYYGGIALRSLAATFGWKTIDIGVLHLPSELEQHWFYAIIAMTTYVIALAVFRILMPHLFLWLHDRRGADPETSGTALEHT